MANVRAARFKLLYNSVDITNDITKYATSIVYTDNDEGESDQVEVSLEDVDALWRNNWYPTKGDKLTLSIGFNDDDTLVNCGSFDIDEIALNGLPDVVTIRAIAAGIKKAIRTKNSKSFENQSLRQIANYIAIKNKLTLIGNIGNIQFERVTQHREKDLSFLRRISMEYGYLFSVRDNQLIFTSVFEIEAGKVVLEIDRSEIRTYNLKDKTGETYKGANVKYHNPVDNSVKKATVLTLSNKDDVTYKQISTEDTIEIRTKAETPAQADLKANAALHKHNSTQQEGSISIEGNPIFVAGNNFLLTGFGVISGKYYIKKSVHKIDKAGGYVTSGDIKRTQVTATTNQSGVKSQSKNSAFTVTNLTNRDQISFKQINQ
jgi:uncharacterized protein